jgi:aryl-alcohol dehydrogenase-like predicted oxidoreductase
VLGSRRQQIMIATKFGVRMAGVDGGLRAKDVYRSAEDSLRRLRTDYLDMLMVHYPSSFMIAQEYPDPDVPIEETLGALDELVQAGKVRTIGCSNFSRDELVEAQDAAARTGVTRFAAIQNEMSALVRDAEADVLPYCDENDVVFLPFFPLASGLLTGKYTDPETYPEGSRMAWASNRMWGRLFTPRNYAAAFKLRDYAEARGHTLLELAFGWLLAHPSIPSVIAGATSPEQVRTNVAAGGWKLTHDEMTEIGALLDATTE